jgi:hypothetical protein
MRAEIQNLSIYLALGLATTAAIASTPHGTWMQAVQTNSTPVLGIYFPEAATFEAAAGRPPEALTD